MLLAIDIGNSSVSFGVFKHQKLIADFHIVSDATYTPQKYGCLVCEALKKRQIAPESLEDIAISSVVPKLSEIIRVMCLKELGKRTLFAGDDLEIDLELDVDFPQKVGKDRLLGALAAHKKHKCALIVVDMGSATTFDAVCSEGVLLGGAIAPGFEVCSEALITKAAQLDKFELKKVQAQSCIGKNTEQAVQVGTFWGYVGLIENIVRRMQQEMKTRAKVIGTGGFANFFAGTPDSFDEIDNHLILQGLCLIYTDYLKII